MPEFLLVAFKLLEIHWAAFFFAVLRFVFEKKRMQKTQEVWLVCNSLLLSLLRQTKGFFCFSFNKRSQKHASPKTWVFCIHFFSKTKRKTVKKNAAQYISCNLKATSKNSGTFETTKKKGDFPLSIVFDQALQLIKLHSVQSLNLVNFGQKS